MTDALGRKSEAVEHFAQRKSLIEAVNRKMWTGACYRTLMYRGQTDDRGNALAVVAGGVARRHRQPCLVGRAFDQSW